MRMLVAVDVEDGGESVLDAAVPWARAWNARVDLAYASEWSPALLPPSRDATEPQDRLRAAWQARADAERTALDALFLQLPDDLRGDVRFLPGRRTEVLSPLTELYDVTVVGTHARRGLARVLLGSVSARLLREARGPVLVVGLGDPPASLTGPLRVGVPVDEREPRILDLVSAWFQDAAVQIAHVVPPGAWSPLLWAGEAHLPQAVDDRVSNLARRLEEAGRHAGLDRAEAVVLIGETSNPGDTLAEWAEREQLDLLAVATRSRDDLSRLVLGSVAQRVAERAPCAVLVVPPGDRLGP